MHSNIADFVDCDYNISDTKVYMWILKTMLRVDNYITYTAYFRRFSLLWFYPYYRFIVGNC